MKMQEVRDIAKKMNLSTGVGRSKQDLIRDIQTNEGNSPCYRAIEYCGVLNCLWREDCQSKKK